MEFVNYEHVGKCYICKKADINDNLGICEECKKKHLKDMILCIEANKNNDGKFTLTGRTFSIDEKGFLKAFGKNGVERMKNTLRKKVCFVNTEVFDKFVEINKNLTDS